MIGAIIFSAALAFFLLGCLIAALFTDILDFADQRFRDDEVTRAIAMGGADISLPEQLRRHAAGPRPDHIERTFHDSGSN